MRLYLSACLTLLGGVLLTLSACSSGEPEDGPLTGQWEFVQGTGLVYRYALTDLDGTIGGTVTFYAGASVVGSDAVTGSRSGIRVVLDHDTHTAGITAHHVLTFESENQLMSGIGTYSDGTSDLDVLITRPLM